MVSRVLYYVGSLGLVVGDWGYNLLVGTCHFSGFRAATMLC
jgi:hypothetical protein